MTEFPLEKEYQKHKNIFPEDVERLRSWLRTQPHLPEEHITDLDLILAYHCCDRSTELAKQVLDLNFTLKTQHTVAFKDRHFDDKIKNIMTDFLMTVLPVRSPEGYACYYARALDPNPKKCIFNDLVRTALMVLDIYQYEEGSWPGLMAVYDLEGLCLGHIATLDMQTLVQLLHYGQEALLLKLKSLHVINAPTFIDRLMAIVKPFLKKEIMDIIHIHTAGSRGLEKFYPIEALPKEAGGNSKTFIEYRDEIMEKVKNGENYFCKDNKKRVLESKRPEKTKTASNGFGDVIGSFRKLDLD